MSKRALTVLLGIFICAGLFSRNSVSGMSVPDDSVTFAAIRARMDSIRQYRPTVAVVMAGAGARGMAHLSVIRYMEELGIPVDLVGGASMGALVSGLYSMGYGVPYLDSLVQDINWSVMMTDRVPDSYMTYKVRKNMERFPLRLPFLYDKKDAEEKYQQMKQAARKVSEGGTTSAGVSREVLAKLRVGLPDGFLFGFNIRNFLSSMTVGYQDSMSFRDFPVPFFCIAADMVKMNSKNWTSGHLSDALSSSMAIPAFFRPLRVEDEILVDGAVRNNFPIDVAKALGADIVIGSEMSVQHDQTDLNSLDDLLLQDFNMLSSDKDAANRRAADLYINHDLEGYSVFSYDSESIAAILEKGYRNCMEYEEEFKAIAALTAGKGPDTTPARTAVNIAMTPVRVGSVEFSGLTPKEEAYLLHRSIIDKSDIFDKARIDDIMARIYGTQAFESVTYRMFGREEPYTLVFDCRKGQTSEFDFGFHIDNEEAVYVDFAAALGMRRLNGGRFLVEGKLGNNPVINTEVSYKPLSDWPVVGASAKVLWNNVRFNNTGSEGTLRAFTTGMNLFLEDSRLTFGRFRLGVAADVEPYVSYQQKESYMEGWDARAHWLSAFLNFRFDTLNDGFFPTKGAFLSANNRYVFSGFSPYQENFSPYFISYVSAGAAVTAGPFTFQPNLYFGYSNADVTRTAFVHDVIAGGAREQRFTEAHIPFFGYGSTYRFFTGHTASLQLETRFALDYKDFLIAKGGVLSNSIPLKGLLKAPDVWAAGLDYARMTPVGPLRAGLYWCSETRLGAAFSIGFFF